MRILNLSSVSVPATATSAVGTATDFSTTRVSPFQQGSSAVLSLRLVSASSVTATVESSTDGGSTYATTKDSAGVDISVAASTAAAESDMRYFNVPNVGQLMRIRVVTTDTHGVGVVRGTLIQN